MFYDLNVQVSPHLRRSIIQTLKSFGYHGVAFNVHVSSVEELKADHKTLHNRKQNSISSNPALHSNFFHVNPDLRETEFIVLERVTVILDNPGQITILSSPLLNDYDLVAVRPASTKLLQQCSEFDIDIISLNMEKQQEFSLKRPQVHVACEKGAVFEIQYACGLRNTLSLRNLISNASAVRHANTGKNIIITSGAKTQMELRAFQDVVNLGTLFKFSTELARNAVAKVPAETVLRGEVRAKTHKGILRIQAKEPDASTAMET